MNIKTVIVLGLATVLALGLAVWLSRGAGEQASNGVNQPLISGLRESLNDIVEVRINTRGKQVTLQKNETGWVVAERGAYLADTSAIREQLLTLADAKLLERKTSNPEYYGQLGVGDPDAEGEGGVLFEVEGPAVSAAVIVGDTNMQRSSSTYVRLADSAESLLINGTFRLDSDPVAWLRKEIIDIPAARIRRVMVVRNEETVFDALKTDETATQFLVTNVPEDRELTSPTAANSVAGSIASLRLDDVGAAAEVERPSDGVTQTTFETFDGLRVITDAWEQDDQRYVVVSAQFDERLIEDDTADGNGESSDEENASSTPSVESEVAAINARTDGWVYVIPSFKFNNLTKATAELLKPDEDEESEAPANSPAG